MEALNLGLDRAVGDRFRTPEEVLVMNAGFDRQFPHFSEDVWEAYALGMQSEKDCASLEEHLLICPVCQNLLVQADEYIQTVRSALALRTRIANRFSKPVAAASTV